jgi:transaldolase
MKLFLDTGHLEEIRHAVDLGVVDGVTTNPTLASKEGRRFRDFILEMCKLLKNGVVNAEVVSTNAEGMWRQARELASWHPNID